MKPMQQRESFIPHSTFSLFSLVTVFTILFWIQIRCNLRCDGITDKRAQKLAFRELQKPQKYQQEKQQQKRYEFKILQLADLHLGEDEFTDWGPQQDVDSLKVIRSVVRAERPDLVVLSGDQLTANNINQNGTVYYRLLIETLIDSGVENWCMIFGNHDDQAFSFVLPNGTRIETKAKTTREDLVQLDMSYDGSWTQRGPRDIFGTSNYVIPLFLNSSSGDDDAVANIYFFDSGGGSIPETMEENQIIWFQSTASNNNLQNRPAVAFQHIPANNNFMFQANKCEGMNGDGGAAILDHDPGILDALIERGGVHFLAVGHNHGNDYCCNYSSSLHLCFGRHSGYGGYGTWKRGAHVYLLELAEKCNTQRSTSRCLEFSWNSWVRLESGNVIHSYRP